MGVTVPHCRKPSTGQPKQSYWKRPDGKIVGKGTGDVVGTYAHSGPPNRGERACKVNGRLVSYVPLADEPSP